MKKKPSNSVTVVAGDLSESRVEPAVYQKNETFRLETKNELTGPDFSRSRLKKYKQAQSYPNPPEKSAEENQLSNKLILKIPYGQNSNWNQKDSNLLS